MLNKISDEIIDRTIRKSRVLVEENANRDLMYDEPRLLYFDDNYRKYLSHLLVIDETILNRTNSEIEKINKGDTWTGYFPNVTLIQRINFEHNQVYKCGMKIQLNYVITQTEYDVLNNCRDMETNNKSEKEDRIRLVLFNIMRTMIEDYSHAINIANWVIERTNDKDSHVYKLVCMFANKYFSSYPIKRNFNDLSDKLKSFYNSYFERINNEY